MYLMHIYSLLNRKKKTQLFFFLESYEYTMLLTAIDVFSE